MTRAYVVSWMEGERERVMEVHADDEIWAMNKFLDYLGVRVEEVEVD